MQFAQVQLVINNGSLKVSKLDWEKIIIHID